MDDTIYTVHGRTYDSWKSSLAETQGHYFDALGRNDAYMVEKWGAEESRIQNIIDHWDILKVEQR